MTRRLRDAGLPTRLSLHSFHVTTITDLLAQGVPLMEECSTLKIFSPPTF